jgi:hypothetical protein
MAPRSIAYEFGPLKNRKNAGANLFYYWTKRFALGRGAI